MKTFQTVIITPNGRIFDGKVTSLTAPGDEGLLGVLPGHAPLFVRLPKGVLTLKLPDGERYYALYAGILEVKPDGNVLILSDHADLSDSKEKAELQVASLTELFPAGQELVLTKAR